MKRVNYWLPPIVWMGFIFFLSTDTFSVRHTWSFLESFLTLLGISAGDETLLAIQLMFRKAAHLTGYAILASLFYRAVRSGRLPRWDFRTAAIAFALAAVYAISDEVHQSFTRERTASAVDVMIDCLGSLIALAILRVILIARAEGTSQEM